MRTMDLRLIDYGGDTPFNDIAIGATRVYERSPLNKKYTGNIEDNINTNIHLNQQMRRRIHGGDLCIDILFHK